MTTENRIHNIISKFGSESLALLHISIGPVQEFIAEARKMRDLWAGSYLLSKVTFEAMTPILNPYGPECIIMPDISESMLYKKWLTLNKGSASSSMVPSTMNYASIPNHFLAIVPDDKIEDITKKITKKTKDFLHTLGEGVKEEISDIIKRQSYNNWADLWDFQLKDHFKVMWVSIPVMEDDLRNNYFKKHDDIQRFMEERKITRTFAPWQGNDAPKCTQCGHREVMGPGFEKNGDFWDLLRRKGRTKWVLNRSERLCAVCLLKRLVSESSLSISPISFDSTSDITSIPFRQVLEGKKDKTEVKELVQNLNELSEELGKGEIKKISDIPGDWFYKEALESNKINKEFRIDESGGEKLNEIKKKVEISRYTLEQVYKLLNLEPSKYYAILMFDADKMGEYLSGKKMPGTQQFSLDWQSAESSKLSSLGCTEWPDIIKGWGGITIYSGGDDILAFGPLKGALDTAWGLKEAFCKIIGTTISGSIVIVHHTDSLRRALEDARSGLDMAKDLYDRNSLVINLKLSSGSSYMGGYKWDIDSDVSFAKDFIGNLVNWMSIKKTGLSPAFVYDLLKETEGFYYTDNWGKIHLKTPDMLTRECQRLLKRHLHEKSPIWKKEKDKIEKVIRSIGKMANPQKGYTHYSFDTRENLESLLKIISFLAREEH